MAKPIYNTNKNEKHSFSPRKSICVVSIKTEHTFDFNCTFMGAHLFDGVCKCDLDPALLELANLLDIVYQGMASFKHLKKTIGTY